MGNRPNDKAYSWVEKNTKIMSKGIIQYLYGINYVAAQY